VNPFSADGWHTSIGGRDGRPAPYLPGNVRERLRQPPPLACRVLGSALPLAVREVGRDDVCAVLPSRLAVGRKVSTRTITITDDYCAVAAPELCPGGSRRSVPSSRLPNGSRSGDCAIRAFAHRARRRARAPRMPSIRVGRSRLLRS